MISQCSLCSVPLGLDAYLGIRTEEKCVNAIYRAVHGMEDDVSDLVALTTRGEVCVDETICNIHWKTLRLYYCIWRDKNLALRCGLKLSQEVTSD